MLYAKLKVAAAVALAAMVCSGAGVVGYRAWAAERPVAQAAKAPAAAPAASQEKQGGGELSPASFEKLFATFKPQEGESKYLEDLPWNTDLSVAWKKAVAERKPLFVFATIGIPLGAT